MENKIFELNLPKTFAVDPNEFLELDSDIKQSENIDLDELNDADNNPDDDKLQKSQVKDKKTLSDGSDDDNIDDPMEPSNSDEETLTNFSEVVKFEIKNGLFNGLEETDVPDDLSLDQLSALYHKALEIKVESLRDEIVKDVTSANEQYSKYIEYLIQGGNPQAVQEALSFNNLIELDTSEEKNQRQILTALMEYKQVPNEDIEDIIDGILDKGKGEQRAIAAIEDFKKIENKILADYKDHERQEKEKAIQQHNQYVNSIKSIVNKGEIGGIKLKKQDQDSIVSAMFSPTEIYEYTNPETGKKEKTRITKLQLLQSQLQNDLEKQVAYALWLLNGSDFKFAKKEGREEEQDSLRKILNPSSSPKVNKSNKNKFNNFIKDLGGHIN